MTTGVLKSFHSSGLSEQRLPILRRITSRPNRTTGLSTRSTAPDVLSWAVMRIVSCVSSTVLLQNADFAKASTYAGLYGLRSLGKCQRAPSGKALSSPPLRTVLRRGGLAGEALNRSAVGARSGANALKL